jgi:hypothetical protein
MYLCIMYGCIYLCIMYVMYVCMYVCIYLSICLCIMYVFIALQPFVGSWPLFQFLDPIHSRWDSLDGDQPVARPLPTHRTTQTQNKRIQTSKPQVAFEPMTPVFERAKTVHALDRAATVIGHSTIYAFKFSNRNSVAMTWN